MDLVCRECGTTYAEAWRCECGGALTFDGWPRPDGERPSPTSFAGESGVWAFEDFLPVGDDPGDRVTLGEGLTPLVGAPEWNAGFKLEYVSPTGSFKDRGAATLVTRAVELAVGTIADDSSGNAGTAIAAYGGRAGLDVTIYAPETISSAKRRMIDRLGARVVEVPGSRDAVTAACHEAVRSGEAWYASHAWHPAFLAGTATFALEVAMQRDWHVPDALVIPVGHGSLFVGAALGFRSLLDAGWIDRLPRLYAAQAVGYAPIVADCHGEDVVESGAVGDRATGIHIRDPAQREPIHEALDETEGDAIAISGESLDAAEDRLHARGFYVEPTSAVAPAALVALRDRGDIGVDEDVVVPLTGSGLKS